ncbi:hypothetical protein BJ973_001561 [Actinoplanes tereljensis]|uniref:YCII-related domain-containing protein n=1 Tax=Paractinoplanes tereljensis TaxID=571912 RepID=A0A919NLS8_9ACTN|nr:YciI family protein [Actinoplanes tereljensis]GIF20533.1 hypothetical protein Ate02nite_32630 [Actinoplanes tereljensis]
MKYLILARGPWDAHLATEMIDAGVHVAAEGLTGPDLAHGTLATPLVTGFYLIDCPTRSEALAWASRTPDTELRPVEDPGGHEF